MLILERLDYMLCLKSEARLYGTIRSSNHSARTQEIWQRKWEFTITMSKNTKISCLQYCRTCSKYKTVSTIYKEHANILM